MQIEFDINNRDKTLVERGLDFACTIEVFAGYHLRRVDDRTDYGEKRFVTAGRLDGGSVVAAEQLTLQTETLQNAAGVLSSSGSTHIESDLLNNGFHTRKPEHRQHANTPGQVLAGDQLSINTVALKGVGTLRSEGDLQLTMQNDPKRVVLALALRGEKFCDANFSKVLAGRDLTISAISLRNLNGAELVAGGATKLNVEKALINGDD